MLSRLLENLRPLEGWFSLRAVVDILVVSYVIYRLILLAKGRRAWWILIGLGVFFLLLLASDLLELVTLNWLLKQVTPLGPVAIVILFYPELREVLEKLGRAEFWGTPLHVAQHGNLTEVVEQVVRAAGILSPLKTGALIVLERETGLDDVVATGTVLDAAVSAELLGTIFHHGTPLHDGAVVIRAGRLAAAECTLPLSDSPNIAANVHMRHRAAIGLSENSDAVVVVVSEETGTISLAINGKLQRGLKPEVLRTKLLEAFGRGPKSRKAGERFGNLPFLRPRGGDAPATEQKQAQKPPQASSPAAAPATTATTVTTVTTAAPAPQASSAPTVVSGGQGTGRRG